MTRAPAFPELLLGGIGMILGLIALGVAFLSPEIAGMIVCDTARSDKFDHFSDHCTLRL